MQEAKLSDLINCIYEKLYQYHLDYNGFDIHWFGTNDYQKVHDISKLPSVLVRPNEKAIDFIQNKIDEKLKHNDIYAKLDLMRPYFKSFDFSENMFRENTKFGEFYELCDLIDKIHLEIVDDLFNNHLDQFAPLFDIIDKFKIDIRSIIRCIHNNNDILSYRKSKSKANYGHVRRVFNIEVRRKNLDKQERLKEAQKNIFSIKDKEESLQFLKAKMETVTEKIIDPVDVFNDLYLMLIRREYQKYFFKRDDYKLLYEKEFCAPHFANRDIGEDNAEGFLQSKIKLQRDITIRKLTSYQYEAAFASYEGLEPQIVISIYFLLMLELGNTLNYSDISDINNHSLAVRNQPKYKDLIYLNSTFELLCNAVLRKILILHRNLSKILREQHEKEVAQMDQPSFIRKKVRVLELGINSEFKKLIVFRGAKLPKDISDLVAECVMLLLLSKLNNKEIEIRGVKGAPSSINVTSIFQENKPSENTLPPRLPYSHKLYWNVREYGRLIDIQKELFSGKNGLEYLTVEELRAFNNHFFKFDDRTAFIPRFTLNLKMRAKKPFYARFFFLFKKIYYKQLDGGHFGQILKMTFPDKYKKYDYTKEDLQRLWRNMDTIDQDDIDNYPMPIERPPNNS